MGLLVHLELLQALLIHGEVLLGLLIHQQLLQACHVHREPVQGSCLRWRLIHGLQHLGQLHPAQDEAAPEHRGVEV